MGSERPVLYLDVDDTLLSMHPRYLPPRRLPMSTWRSYGYAPPGAREFMEWALATFEVRWLTWWCGGSEMEDAQRERLEGELGLAAGSLAAIRSTRFAAKDANPRCLKTSGINWPEHHAGRPFVWLEDWISDDEAAVLRGHGFADCWIPCHVTDDPHALERAHAVLRERFPDALPPPPASPRTASVLPHPEATDECL